MIKRYRFVGTLSDPHAHEPIESDVGQWVKFEDFQAIMTHKPEANSLEHLAEITLERIAEFFGKCVNSDKFAGFGVDELETPAGLPASLTLVACDENGDEPIRRVARTIPKVLIAH